MDENKTVFNFFCIHNLHLHRPRVPRSLVVRNHSLNFLSPVSLLVWFFLFPSILVSHLLSRSSSNHLHLLSLSSRTPTISYPTYTRAVATPKRLDDGHGSRLLGGGVVSAVSRSHTPQHIRGSDASYWRVANHGGRRRRRGQARCTPYFTINLAASHTVAVSGTASMRLSPLPRASALGTLKQRR